MPTAGIVFVKFVGSHGNEEKEVPSKEHLDPFNFNVVPPLSPLSTDLMNRSLNNRDF